MNNDFLENNNKEEFMSYKIKELPIEERPRERLKEIGPNEISNNELLSILLKSGLKNKNVQELATELLKNYPIESLKDCSMQDLMKIKGIGEAKAIELLASIELGKRIYLKNPLRGKKLMKPEEIWNDAKYYIHGKKQEYFYGYYFNTKQELIERKLIFVGTINTSTTHTREIFKEAYKSSATSIICLHNHPTNDVTPSKADIEFTKALMETGRIQGIPVLDHIIAGEDHYYSFYEEWNKEN